MTLVPLVRELDRRERWRGATCLYRALLDVVLARANTAAYQHARKSRFWACVAEVPDAWASTGRCGPVRVRQ